MAVLHQTDICPSNEELSEKHESLLHGKGKVGVFIRHGEKTFLDNQFKLKRCSQRITEARGRQGTVLGSCPKTRFLEGSFAYQGGPEGGSVE